MSVTPEQLAGIQVSHPGAKLLSDGSGEFIFLPRLPIQVGDEHIELDALLCPRQHGGYNTRLFLAAPIPQRQRNWASHNILGRIWHAWSWQGVSPSLPLPQMLLAHLKALR